MIQKTRVVQSEDEFFDFLRYVKEDEAYLNAKGKLLVIYESWPDAEYIHSLLNIAKREMPDVQVVGMTTGGGGSISYSDAEGTTCCFSFFKEECFSVHIYNCRMQTPFSVGDEVGEELLRMTDVRGVMIFSAGFSLNVSDFFTSVGSYDVHVPFFGAIAGVRDPYSPTELPYIFTDELFSYGILVVIFYGSDLFIKVGYNFGWKPFGKRMTITKARNSWVYTIDDGPAVDIYKKYLGVLPNKYFVQNSADFPLVVDRKGVLVGRIGVAGLDRDKLEFFGDIHEGESVQFSYGNLHDILMETLNDSISLSMFETQGIFIFACLNRNAFLKEDADKELSCYESIASNMCSYFGGVGELYLDENGGGGVLNNALVSVGFREGELHHKELMMSIASQRRFEEEDDGWNSENMVIPLSRRLVTFLEATTAELEQMAAMANAANKAKSEFLSSMSHEIRTPINAVLGLDEMILREATDASIREYASNIQSSGKALLALINNVLDFSKIEAGKMEIIDDDYDLASSINDLMNMILPRVHKKNLEFVVNIDNSVPCKLYGDENKIKQCALNVLTNAVKYTNEGFVIFNVGWEKVDDDHIMMKVSVSDTGIGIKAEDLERLFQPFERMEEMRNRSIEGTGLGLNIVGKLLHMMDSKLEVQSEYGKGSTFYFNILQRVVDWAPMGDFNERYRKNVAQREYQETFQAPEAKILVVDDITVNLTVVKGLLKATRIQIDTAKSGAEAIEMACAKRYDLLFIDHQMPEMDGIETLTRLHHEQDCASEFAPTIALTANAIAGAKEKYLEVGFTDYLSKPVAGEALEAILIKYLPPALVLHKGDAGFVEQAAPEVVASPSHDLAAFFFQRFHIDIDAALKYCGGMENFLAVAGDFYDLMDSQIEKIDRLSKEEDIHEYVVQVHALKNSARLIGAINLSEQALHLEKSGDANNRAEIDEKTPKLLKDYASYKELLAALLGKPLAPVSAADDDRPEISQSELDDAVATIREFVQGYDYANADAVMQMLDGYRLPESFIPTYKKIKEGITKVDHDSLMELLK